MTLKPRSAASRLSSVPETRGASCGRSARRARVVRDEHQGRAAVALQREEQVDDLPAGGLVEIAGRLVGHQNRRVRRQRAGDRDALLLAAGELRRDNAAACRRGRPPAIRPPARAKASAAPASSSGRATFSSAVMVGTRWKDWNTMPMRRPRKRASASSSSGPRSVPSTTTRPESGRSSPAIVISSVDLPEPDGPTRPTASPRATVSDIPFRICTRAAPRPRLRSRFCERDGLVRHRRGPDVLRRWESVESEGSRPAHMVV